MITVYLSLGRLHYRRIVHDCRHKTFMLGLWEREEISRKTMPERDIVFCSCVDIELKVISGSTAGLDWDHQSATKSG